eukprot:7458200-Lingulodinium_polyedra.AAC.1
MAFLLKTVPVGSSALLQHPGPPWKMLACLLCLSSSKRPIAALADWGAESGLGCSAGDGICVQADPCVLLWDEAGTLEELCGLVPRPGQLPAPVLF